MPSVYFTAPSRLGWHICVCIYKHICMWIYIYREGACVIKWRRKWGNDYRHRKWKRWFEIKSRTRVFTFHFALISFSKVCPYILSSCKLKVNIRIDWNLRPWRMKTELKLTVLCLKIDFLTHSAHSEGQRAIGQMSRVSVHSTGDRCSIPGRVIPKTQKMVIDAALFNTQHYKVRIKGKVEQSWEWSSALSYTSV